MSSGREGKDRALVGQSRPEWVPPASPLHAMSSELKDLSVAFLEYLQEKGCRPSTLQCYFRSVSLLNSYMQREGEGRSVRDISVEDLRAFTVQLFDRYAVTTVSGHVVGVRQFFAFLETSGGIVVSPARNLVPPPPSLQTVRILAAGDLKQLLQACVGDDFVDRRDMALFRVFMATGARPEEVLGLGGMEGTETGDLDLDEATVLFRADGGLQRKCPLDPRTVSCLKRYLGVRKAHTKSYLPDLWLTGSGGLSRGGLNGIVRRRRKKAGLSDFKLHQIRSTFANRWIAGGGNEGDLMRLLGIADRRTIDRYAESVASSTAIRNASAILHSSGDQYDSPYSAPK